MSAADHAAPELPERLYVFGKHDSRGVCVDATEVIYEVPTPEDSEEGETAIFATAETDAFAAELVRRYNESAGLYMRVNEARKERDDLAAKLADLERRHEGLVAAVKREIENMRPVLHDAPRGDLNGVIGSLCRALSGESK